MLIHRKIRIGRKSLEAVCFSLFSKNLIVIRGKHGYIMCGYINLKAAEMFKDVAVKVTGVSSIKDVLRARVNSSTSSAKRLGIYKNQPVKDVLKIIA